MEAKVLMRSAIYCFADYSCSIMALCRRFSHIPAPMADPVIQREVARRRTFAIISHPDAGKTTLTEKLLLMGGAIQAAGAVKARGDARRARSDWMKVEQERGISVSASAMTFLYNDHIFNLVDTPGHQDFSEDTYRTLTAVDAAIMVIDAAKGIEAQTLKLFEVCRLRDIPIITFINKLALDEFPPWFSTIILTFNGMAYSESTSRLDIEFFIHDSSSSSP